MQIKKTVGKPGIGGTRKDYAIHTQCGEKFYAKAVGSQGYECGGINFDTIKALKAHIVAGGFDSEAPDEQSTAEGADTWDCVHPCAWLCIIEPVQTCKIKLATLDAYGWLDCMGRPDIARAEREIKRVENLKKAIDDPNNGR